MMDEDVQKEAFTLFIDQIKEYDMERNEILNWLYAGYQNNKFNG